LISSSACNKGNQKEILPPSRPKKKKENKETLHNGKGEKCKKGRRKLPFNVTVPVAISLQLTIQNSASPSDGPLMNIRIAFTGPFCVHSLIHKQKAKAMDGTGNADFCKAEKGFRRYGESNRQQKKKSTPRF
jgi:hypothetical protein